MENPTKPNVNVHGDSVNDSSHNLKEIRSILAELESPTSMLPRASYKKQLGTLRKSIADIARKEAQKYCNCELITLATSWEWQAFEAKMNISCPIHGPSRLGAIFTVGNEPMQAEDVKLLELVRLYDQRSLDYKKAQIGQL